MSFLRGRELLRTRLKLVAAGAKAHTVFCHPERSEEPMHSVLPTYLPKEENGKFDYPAC